MGLNKSQASRLEQLKQEFEVSKQWRKQFEPSWREYQLWYTGRQERVSIGSGDPPFVNLLLSTVQIAVASSTVEDPAFEAIPRTADYVQFQPIVEAVLDATWEAGGVQAEFASASGDRFITGDGWLKTTWERVEAENVDPDPEVIDAMNQAVALVAAARGLGPGEVPSPQEITNFVRRKTTDTLSNNAVVRRVDPFSVYVDSEATCDKELRWIAQRVWEPLDVVQENPQFRPGVRSEVKASHVLSDDNAGQKPTDPPEGDHSKGLQRVALIEMYDIERQELMIWADDQEGLEPLFGPHPVAEDMGYPHPFTRLPCIDVPNTYYSMGFVEASVAIQNELNEQRLQEALVRRASIPKALIHRKDADSLGEWWESDKIMATGIVEDDEDDLSKAVYLTPPPQVSGVLFQNGQDLITDMDRQVGISSMERGVETGGSTTATEVNAINGYISARARSFMRGTRSAMEEVARRILVLMQKNLDQHDYVWLQDQFGLKFPEPDQRLPPPAPDPYNKRTSHPYDGITLAGEWQLKIKVDTGTADGPIRRQQQAMQFLQVMTPFLASGSANQIEVMLYVLKNGFGIPNPERFLAPQPAVQAPPTGDVAGMASPAGANAPAVGAGQPPGMEAQMAQHGLKAVS